MKEIRAMIYGRFSVLTDSDLMYYITAALCAVFNLRQIFVTQDPMYKICKMKKINHACNY